MFCQHNSQTEDGCQKKCQAISLSELKTVLLSELQTVSLPELQTLSLSELQTALLSEQLLDCKGVSTIVRLRMAVGSSVGLYHYGCQNNCIGVKNCHAV